MVFFPFLVQHLCWDFPQAFFLLLNKELVCIRLFDSSAFLCEMFLIQYLYVGVFPTGLVICDTDLGILGRNLILFVYSPYF